MDNFYARFDSQLPAAEKCRTSPHIFISKSLEHEKKVNTRSQCMLEEYVKDNNYVGLILAAITATMKYSLM